MLDKKGFKMEKGKDFVQEFTAILVKHKIFSQAEARVLKKNFDEASQESFDEFLLDEGLIDKEDLLRALAEYYQMSAVDLAGYFFQTFLLRKFPKDLMIRRTFIPLEVDQNVLIVVAGNPDHPELLSLIGKYVSYDIQFRVSIKQDIIDAVQEFYDKSDLELDEEVAAMEDFGVKNVYDIEIEGGYSSPGEEEDL